MVTVARQLEVLVEHPAVRDSRAEEGQQPSTGGS